MSESSATLPTACVVATLLWWLPQGGYSTVYLLGWLTCALTSYIILEMNAQSALLRIRSRMVSALWLFVIAALGFLHPLQTGTVLLFCLSVSFFCLLRTCDAYRPEPDTMRAYLWLSIGSLLWPPFLLLSIVHLWSQAVYLRSLTRRSFGAAFIGIVLPYALWVTVAFAFGHMEPFVDHATSVIAPFLEPFYWQWAIDLAQTTDWNGFSEGFVRHMTPVAASHMVELSALLFILLLGFTGFVHYVRKSYDDKIRVRMCYYSMMVMQVVIILWMALQPQHFSQLFPLLVLTTIPAAAHFIALTHTWLSNAWVVVLILLLIGVGVCTLALPLYFDWPLPQSDLFSDINEIDFSSAHIPVPRFIL